MFQRRTHGAQIQDQENQETRTATVNDTRPHQQTRAHILYSITLNQFRNAVQPHIQLCDRMLLHTHHICASLRRRLCAARHIVLCRKRNVCRPSAALRRRACTCPSIYVVCVLVWVCSLRVRVVATRRGHTHQPTHTHNTSGRRIDFGILTAIIARANGTLHSTPLSIPA